MYEITSDRMASSLARREAWALFPGSVAYIWHAGTKAGIGANPAVRVQWRRPAAQVKGFGCRPVVTYLRALGAGVRKPPRKEPAGAG